jgi:hypothetical protein
VREYVKTVATRLLVANNHLAAQDASGEILSHDALFVYTVVSLILAKYITNAFTLGVSMRYMSRRRLKTVDHHLASGATFYLTF